MSKHLQADFPLRLTTDLLTSLVAASPDVVREHLVDETSLVAAYIIEYLRA
jgi:hypothetical protein